MTTISAEEFLKGGAPKLVQPAAQAGSDKPSGTLGDLATGFAKGGLQTAIGTAQMAQGLGQRAIATVDPTRNLQQVREQTGFKSLQGPAAAEINTQLEAKNPAEKAGKALEFVVELFYPVGKTTEAASIAGKGKKVIGASFDNLGEKIASLEDNVGGAKDKVLDTLVKLDDKTKTALSRTPKEKFQEVVEQGKAALLDDKNRTPLEAVGDQVIEGLKQAKDRASSIGQQKAEYLNQAKVGLKRVGTIVRDAALATKKQFSGVTLDSSDKKLVTEFFNELKKISDNPTLKDADKAIDFLQEKLYKSTSGDVVQVTDRVVGPLRKILGELNGKAGKVGGDAYQKFNKDYSDLVNLVSELNKKVGKEGQTAGAFVKRLFSPSDARTKELFELLQKYTGEDYFRDARLAKFIMETLGDGRAASLLEQIPKTPTGVIEKAVDFGVKKLANPIKAAERFIERAVK